MANFVKSCKFLGLFTAVLVSVVSSTCETYHLVMTSSEELDDEFYTGPITRPSFTTITNGETQVFQYLFNESMLSKWPAYQMQFYAESELPTNPNSDTGYPLLVTVHWHGFVRSWEVPVNLVNDTRPGKNVHRYSQVVGKTIWNFPEDIPDRPWNLTVEVTIFTEVTVYYKVRIINLKNFNVTPGKKKNSIKGYATPSAPAIYKFNVPRRGWDYMFIHATSDSTICSLMSIQSLHGPFLDKDGKTDATHISETFTMKTGLTLKGDTYRKGFLIVFHPFENDSKCKKQSESQNDSSVLNDMYRRKRIKFEVLESMGPVHYYSPLALPILLLLTVGITVLLMLWFFHHMRCSVLKNKEKPSSLPQVLQREHNVFKSNINIDDLIVIEPSRLVDQSRRYCRAAIITSTFYCVPVFQLILTFSKRLLETGDYDVCYFNHFCSHMLGNFHDFNHMYSNIGYIFFGCLFGIIVRIRQVCYKPNQTLEDEMAPSPITPYRIFFPKCEAQWNRGVFNHYGLLYCLAFALFMTGIMSAGYHICPNQNNFQFDTVFMYTIAAITVVTIYQFRHPTYLSANFTFTALAVVTCITVLGLLWEKFFIRVIFSVVHMCFLVFSLPKVCYTGFVRKNGDLVFHWNEMMEILLIKLKDDWKHGRMHKIQHYVWRAPNNPEIVIIPGPGRLILPGFLLFVNCVAIVLMWTILCQQNFATQVLFICVINGSMYTVFYSIMKMYHGECLRLLWIQPGFYLFGSFILWGYAMYFFLDELSTWETSPAESRLKNSECIVMGFYDSHDMWHFLSSAALFSSAMVLLTVDDDLVDQPKSSIPVF